ncbi:MAG: hypothetical protein QXR64_08080 [Pyrobaculum sp.]
MRGITTFQAVLIFAVSAAVAVLILASVSFPPVKPYGEPLPYIAVRNTTKGVQLGAFDYSGLQPRVAHFYVNGRYAGSGAGWADVYARCGDYVEALFQYDGLSRRVAGRVECGRPLTPPGGTRIRQAPVKLIEAYNAINGYVDVTGLPVRLYLQCDTGGPHIYYNRYYVWLSLESLGDSTMCMDSTCSDRFLLSSRIGWDVAGSYAQFTDVRRIKVLRLPSAFFTNYLGGVNVTIAVRAVYEETHYRDFEYSMWRVYATVRDPVGGSRDLYLGSCYKSRYIVHDVRQWTEYRQANASGVLDFCWKIERFDASTSPVYRVTSFIWTDKTGNVVGARVYATPTGDADCKVTVPITKMTLHNEIVKNLEVLKNTLIDGIVEGALTERDRKLLRGLLELLRARGYSPEEAFKILLFANFDAVYGDIPQVAINRTEVIPVAVRIIPSIASNSYTMVVGVVDPSSLGAVLATSAMPLPFTLPKVRPPPGNWTPVFT